MKSWLAHAANYGFVLILSLFLLYLHQFPEDYPSSAPNVVLLTTNGGRTRSCRSTLILTISGVEKFGGGGVAGSTRTSTRMAKCACQLSGLGGARVGSSGALCRTATPSSFQSRCEDPSQFRARKTFLASNFSDTLPPFF